MAFVHGKGVVVTIGTKDISAYSNKLKWTRTADSHDTTTFGKSAHTYAGGLLDGKFSIDGLYDTTALLSPRNAIMPMLGTSVALVYKPEGTSTGKPVDTVNVVITQYEEGAEIDDMVTFSIEGVLSDTVVTTASP